MWNQYTTDKLNIQYFVYNFTKQISDKESMIGITVDIDNKIYAAHYSDDTKITDHSIFDNYKEYLKGFSDYDLKRYNLSPNIYDILLSYKFKKTETDTPKPYDEYMLKVFNNLVEYKSKEYKDTKFYKYNDILIFKYNTNSNYFFMIIFTLMFLKINQV